MRFYNLLKYITILILVFGLSNCQTKSTNTTVIIPKEKFVQILTEMQLLESHSTLPSVNQPFVRDSIINYYNGIFKKYEVNREEFYFTLKEYGKNPILMTEIYDLMLEELRNRALLYDKIDVTTEEPIMAFSIQQISEIIFQTPLAEVLRNEDTINVDQFRDSLFLFIDKNDSLLQTFGVNRSSFKYSFIINTTQSVLFEQLKQQLKMLYKTDSLNHKTKKSK